MILDKLSSKISKYHFELKHLTVLLFMIVAFQIFLSFIQKSSIQSFLKNTQEWYQRDSAERMANLSTTSLELLVGNMKSGLDKSEEEKQNIIESFNIIFSQQLLEPNVEETVLIIIKDKLPVVINDGTKFYNFLHNNYSISPNEHQYNHIVELFIDNIFTLSKEQEIITILDSNQTFHTLVPFVPFGEFVGVFYIRNKPDFSIITQEVLSSFNEVALIYTTLILVGLLVMYYISSYTVKERDETSRLFYEEKEQHLKDKIEHDKESMFTKRIYHTHHKAEKVMGFIKEDLRGLTNNNTEETRNRVIKYSNFISRVIYDMKWYDPPIQTIRNSVFNTNINSVIQFIVDNIFLRLSKSTEIFAFDLNLDKSVPKVHINEFVIWEVIEPIIQNSIDHSRRDNILIKISTTYNPDKNITKVIISDNGEGIDKDLLQSDKNGIPKIFLENVTRSSANENRGYGCYIAYQMATARCGWKMRVENLLDGGCKFIIEIQN